MKLSVVIPTYNRKDSLRRTLDGLSQQTFPVSDFEVVVVSDGCTDGTMEMLAEYARTAPYTLQVINQHNSGPSKARNRGIQEAQHDVIVFLDDDVEPTPEFLSRHAAHHQQENKIAILGPMSPDPARACEEPLWIAWEHAKLQQIYDLFRPGGEYAGCLAGAIHFYSGNASVRKEWLLVNGGFDESFTRQEDVELAERMAHNTGIRFRFDFAAEGLHRPQRTFESWLRIPKAYGVFDAQRVHSGALSLSQMQRNIKKHNVATRALAQLCLACPLLLSGMVAILTWCAMLLYRLRIKSLALVALSAVYNICYIVTALRPLSMSKG